MSYDRVHQPDNGYRGRCTRHGYDVEDLLIVCQSFICKVELTVENLPRWLAVSAKHDIDAAIERCLAFVAADEHFTAICKCVHTHLHTCSHCHILDIRHIDCLHASVMVTSDCHYRC